MRVFAFFSGLMLFFSSLANASEVTPVCAQSEQKISELSDTLACDLDDLAEKLIEGDEVVPTHLYHYGKKDLLFQDVAAHTVPRDAWDQFIMPQQGRSGRYDLKPFRQGLYGTAGLDTNFFGNDDTYSWLIEIDIDPRCVAPSKVATFINLPNDPRFLTWFKQAKGLPFASLDEFKRHCILGSFPMAEIIGHPGMKTPESDCEKALNSFLSDSDIKIVQDYAIRKSFYVRDRSCIKNIRGTADDLLQIFAEEPYLWHAPCRADDGRPDEADKGVRQVEYNQNATQIPRLLIAAMLDTSKPLTDQDYNLLLQNLQTARWTWKENFKEVLKARKRCHELRKDSDFQKLLRTQTPSNFDQIALEAFSGLCH